MRTKMRTWILSIIITALFDVFHISEANTTSADHTGIFTYINQFRERSPFMPVYQRALSDPYIDGAAIAIPWNELEPQEGTFNWQNVDRVLGYALQARKKISIGIVAGSWTPSWVFDSAGAQRVVFTSYDRSPPMGICTQNFVQPVVWDPIFLGKYRNALTALAAHLKTIVSPGGTAYDSVVAIKLGGVSLTTEEVRINAHPPGGPCGEPDSTQLWLQAGYRPSKILSAFSTMASDAARIFPEKPLNIATIHRGAFPPIDENGRVYTLPPPPNDVDRVTLAIIDEAVRSYQKRMIVMWNALSQNRSRLGVPGLPAEILTAKANGSLIGWQTNGFMGVWGGVGCIYPIMQIGPCRTVSDFQDILDIGINTGGHYLEVHAVSVGGQQQGYPEGVPKDFTPAFREARQRLRCTKPSDASLRFLKGTACAPLASACNSAGYYLGCQLYSTRGGLLGSCFNPIVFGKQTLPDVPVTASQVSACRSYCAQNPGRCR